jgi:hypothetical protein
MEDAGGRATLVQALISGPVCLTLVRHLRSDENDGPIPLREQLSTRIGSRAFSSARNVLSKTTNWAPRPIPVPILATTA